MKYNSDNIRLGLCILSFLLMIYIPLSAYKKSIEYRPPLPATVWHDVKIEVTYQKEGKDTFNLEVYDTPFNIYLKNGDITYYKTTKQSGGIVSNTVTLCSFVRSFRILSSVKHVINE
jgi:hypothetical protein